MSIPTDSARPPEPRQRWAVTSPRVLLRLEGLGILLVSGVGFHLVDQSWWLFVLTLLAPDVGLAGYLLGPRWGARIYNLTHTLIFPVLLVGWTLVQAAHTMALALALVWIAHIGMDRMFGFGLKAPDSFRRTHLQRVP